MTMGNYQLSDFLVIAVENDIAAKMNVNDAVSVFSKMKNPRYPRIA